MKGAPKEEAGVEPDERLVELREKDRKCKEKKRLQGKAATKAPVDQVKEATAKRAQDPAGENAEGGPQALSALKQPASLGEKDAGTFPIAEQPAGADTDRNFVSNANSQHEGGAPEATRDSKAAAAEAEKKAKVEAEVAEGLRLSEAERKELTILEGDHGIKEFAKKQAEAEGFRNAWRKYREQEKLREAQAEEE